MNLLINNIGPHYRKAIWEKLGKELNFSFAFDNKEWKGIKSLSENEINSFGENTKYYPLKNIFFKNIMIWQKGLLKLLLKHKFENVILLGYPYCLNYWLGLILLKIKGINIIIWTHGIYGKESEVKKYFKYVFFQISDTVLTYSNWGRNQFLKMGMPTDKVKTVYNSIPYPSSYMADSDKMTILNDYSIINKELPIVIIIGRLTKEKKLDLLLLSKKTLKERENLNFNLLLIGDGKMAETLKKRSHQLSLNDVYFLGSLYDEEKIKNLFSIAHVCVSPGNVGLTAMHSLFYGTPVITHNNFANQGPEFESINDNITGSFFEENDINDLAQKIKKWIQTEKTAELQKKCRKIIIEKYNATNQLEIIKEVIK